jgi:hypothetical protein
LRPARTWIALRSSCAWIAFRSSWTWIAFRAGIPRRALRTAQPGFAAHARLALRPCRPCRPRGSGRAAVRHRDAPRLAADRERGDARRRHVGEAEREASAPVCGDAVRRVEHDQEVRVRGAPGDHQLAAGNLRLADADLAPPRRRRGERAGDRHDRCRQAQAILPQ